MYRSILLVDDDSDDQLLFNEAVHGIDASIRLETADNGKHALNKLNNALLLPELIFVDLHMPLVNGYELISQIKQTDKLRSIPLVAFTTSNSVFDANRAQSLGADAFLTKSPDFKDLIFKLRKVLQTDFSSRTDSHPIFKFAS